MGYAMKKTNAKVPPFSTIRCVNTHLKTNYFNPMTEKDDFFTPACFITKSF